MPFQGGEHFLCILKRASKAGGAIALAEKW
jgi:hypothetical protein